MAYEVQVKRVTLTGASTKVSFDGKAKAFLVKNFTTGNVFAQFTPITDEDKAIKIPTMIAEEVFVDLPERNNFDNGVNDIYLKGSGEVEVRQIWLTT